MFDFYRGEEEEEDYQERVEEQLAAQEEDDAERIIEESRRRRQAILDKYKQKNQQEQELPEPKKAKMEVDKAPSVTAGIVSGLKNTFHFLLFTFSSIKLRLQTNNVHAQRDSAVALKMS